MFPIDQIQVLFIEAHKPIHETVSASPSPRTINLFESGNVRTLCLLLFRELGLRSVLVSYKLY